MLANIKTMLPWGFRIQLAALKKTLKALFNLLDIGYRKESYSQDGEDIVLSNTLQNLFGDKKGFYVDIGAFHPKLYSNTYIFYKKGWSGINIDAAPGKMRFFKNIRKRDINLECAISQHTDKEMTFYVFEGTGAVNTFDEQHSEQMLNNGYILKEKIYVKPRKLSDVLDEYLLPRKQIDLMSIDVESHELDVLKSNDWEKYRPLIICIEILGSSLEEPNRYEVVKFLKSLDYIPFAKTGISWLFKDKKFTIT